MGLQDGSSREADRVMRPDTFQPCANSWPANRLFRIKHRPSGSSLVARSLADLDFRDRRRPRIHITGTLVYEPVTIRCVLCRLHATRASARTGPSASCGDAAHRRPPLNAPPPVRGERISHTYAAGSSTPTTVGGKTSSRECRSRLTPARQSLPEEDAIGYAAFDRCGGR